MSNADEIRRFVLDRYVVPARQRGASEITIRAGDVHKDMALSNAMPNVCAVLDGQKFAQLAGVSLLERRGPPRGSNVYFRFDLSGTPVTPTFSQDPPKTARPHTPPKPTIRTLHPHPSHGTAAYRVDARSSLVLVSCVKSKLSRAAPARELYTSPLFQKMRAFAENSGAPWFILSAQHGLVAPDVEIAPYELTLNKMGIDQRRAWADRVLTALVPHLEGIERVVFLAGMPYREFLVGPLEQRGVTVEVPMEGLSIGNQLSWLSRSE